DADLAAGSVCSSEQCDIYEKYRGAEKRRYDPTPADQREVRASLSGLHLRDIRATSAPVPGDADPAYHTAIPGIPSLAQAAQLGAQAHQHLREWEQRYMLPAAIH